MYTGNYKVIWNSGTVEHCCGMCVDIANDHEDVVDIDLVSYGSDCAWCLATDEYSGEH